MIEYQKIAEMPPRRWRSWVTNALFVGVLFSGFMILVMFYSVPRLGSLAWHRDVDEKIAAAVSPVDEKLIGLSDALAAQTTSMNVMLADITASKLRSLIKTRCQTRSSSQKEYLTEQIQEYAESYEVIRGKSFHEPGCDQIIGEEL